MGEVERLNSLAEQINAEHRAFVGTLRKTVEHGIRAGELLAEAKAQCPHGTWLPWLEQNFEGSTRTAQEYMRLHNHRDEIRAKTRDSAHLSISGALKEIASPREAASAEASLRAELEYHQRKAIEGLAKIRQTSFVIAENISELYQSGLWKQRNDNFAEFLVDWSGGKWIYYGIPRLLDDKGVPRDLFQMAGIIYDEGPDWMLETLLDRLPEPERQRLREEWACEAMAEKSQPRTT